MGKLLIRIVFTFLSFFCSDNSLAQEQGVTIYYINGVEVKGVQGDFSKKHFRLKKELVTQKIKIPYDSIRRINISNENGIVKAYEKHQIKGINKTIFFEILFEGQVSLLKPHSTFGVYGGLLSPIGNNVYFKKNKDRYVGFFYDSTKGPVFVNYKKMILKNFGDCKKLVDKLENKQLKAMQTFSVVDFYNENCF